MLELADRKCDHADVVAAKGRLDRSTSPLMEAHCRDLLHAGCKSVVLDFQELNSLDSEALRSILGLSKHIHAGGGKMVFTGIRGRVRDMFDIAGFLDAFPVVDQVESDLP